MSTGFELKRMVCKIGKKSDKSDCAKKDCDNCRHYVGGFVWQDCMNCKHECADCPIGQREITYQGEVLYNTIEPVWAIKTNHPNCSKCKIDNIIYCGDCKGG